MHLIRWEKKNDAGIDVSKSAVMTPEQRAALKAHVREIAKILHEDAKEKGMPVESLGEIEQTVRHQLQTHVSPDLGLFYR